VCLCLCRCRYDCDPVKHVAAHPIDARQFLRGQDMMDRVIGDIDIKSSDHVAIG
jgi:hypothetical protein